MSLDRYTCEQTFHRLQDYLDREIGADERLLVEAHLEICEVCANEFRFERTVIDEVRMKLRRLDAPQDLLDRVMQSLRET